MAQLRASAEALSAADLAVIALDPAGRVAFWSGGAGSMTGWATETVQGRPLVELLVGRSRFDLADGLAVLAAGRSWAGGLDLDGPRGRALRVEVSAEPVRFEGEVVGAAGVLRPLSAGHAERRVRQLSAALTHVADALVVCDEDGRVTEWNPAAEDMFGWSRPEMLGTPVLQLVPDLEQRSFTEVWRRLCEGLDVPPYEALRLRRDGTAHVVSVHAAAFREGGAFAGTVATFRPLSSRQGQERLLFEVLPQLPVVVAAYDGEGRVTLVAGGGYERAGTTFSLADGTPLLDTTVPGSALHEAVIASLAGRSSRVHVPVDDRVWQCHVEPVQQLGGRAAGFVLAVDVTSERVLDDRLQALLSVAPLALVTFDAAGRITYAAGSAFASMEVEPQDMLGWKILDLYGDNPQIEQAVMACLAGERVDVVAEYSGRVWDLHYRSYRGAGGAVTGGLVIAQDSTDRAGAAPAASSGDSGSEPLRGLLERDHVTGLPGRRAVQRRLEDAVPAGEQRGLALVDLDAFSLVEQTYGRETGDVVLREVADRLLHLGGRTFVGRWEADVFVVLLDAVDGRAEMGAAVAAVAAAVAEPVLLPDGPLHLTASIGVAVSDAAPATDLLGSAELALRQAQQAGRARACWFTADLRPAFGGVRLASDLRRALGSDELRLHYQPVVELASRRTVGVEALLRWEHPREGLLLPGSFIGLAERTELIHDLGRWVATEASRAAANLAAAGLGGSMAINVSARQLVEGGLVALLQEVLEQSGCSPSAFVVEVTESAMMTDMDAAVGTLRELKDLGVGLALDDFGTGYSSLLYLKHFPVDVIKIDRSFVAGLGVDHEDGAIVASTVSLAHSVGVTCVAEGVETVDQLELLGAMGCDYAQGYLFSRPLPYQQLQSWLNEHSLDVRRPKALPPPPPPELDEILRMHTAGASLNTIAASLNVQGKRTDRGTRWRAQSVAAVIARSAYPSLTLRDGRG